jgi:putative mycofactocin binding protein MftB
MTARSDATNPKSGVQNLKSLSEARSSLKVPRDAQPHMRYRPTDGVQVREETFGLLFYNYRGPRLYFVPSKDLIDADFFSGRQTVSGLIKYICTRKGLAQAEVGERIAKILAKLEDKGLIYGQSIR